MKPSDFCYWLRGFFELAGEGELTEKQVKIISEHLRLVMEEKEKPRGWSYAKLSDASYPGHKHLPDGVVCYDTSGKCWENYPTISC